MWNNESKPKNVKCEVGQQQSYYQDEQLEGEESLISKQC